MVVLYGGGCDVKRNVNAAKLMPEVEVTPGLHWDPQRDTLRCLLCPRGAPYKRASDLSQHTNRAHQTDWKALVFVEVNDA